MASFSQLERYTNDLTVAARTLADQSRSVDFGLSAQSPDAFSKIHRAKRDVLANMARLQILLAEPNDFIQHLAGQVCFLCLFLMSYI